MNKLYEIFNKEEISTNSPLTEAINNFTAEFAIVKRPVQLQAEYSIGNDIISTDATSTDRIIRENLAIKLARKMIEEDLITIQSNQDPLVTTFRATVKLVQE